MRVRACKIYRLFSFCPKNTIAKITIPFMKRKEI
nr:MAG TPA: hypothetical protein [Bacteriophage sp.]